MKQTLQTKLSQHLALTPQLQQAIKLLQLSSQELRQEIEQAIEQNPLLEYLEEIVNDLDHKDEIPEEESPDKAVALDTDQLPSEFATDSQWEDFYPNSSSLAKNDNQTFEIQRESKTNLTEHLLWQMKMSHFSEVDQAIATAIIDAINDEGFLTCSLEEIHHNFADNEDIELDEVEAVLRQIHNYDPTGVGARNLQECLLIQLRHLPPDTPFRFDAEIIITHYLDLLGHHDYRQIIKEAKFRESQLAKTIKLIQTLNPKPGTSITPDDTEYVIPDLIVSKRNNEWHVSFNKEALPKIRINPEYTNLVPKNNSTDYTFLHDHMQEARWFIKSLTSRNDTLLNVAINIIKHQKDFLDQGEEFMKPLILQTVADDLGMHESTISRITTQKYMLTPRGVFELKYFFSSHLNTDDGLTCSSTAIRAMIKKLIANENTLKPLSDNKITQLLEKEGIHVARRTVAKYREEMAIPPSNERKCLTG